MVWCLLPSLETAGMLSPATVEDPEAQINAEEAHLCLVTSCAQPLGPAKVSTGFGMSSAFVVARVLWCFQFFFQPTPENNLLAHWKVIGLHRNLVPVAHGSLFQQTCCLDFCMGRRLRGRALSESRHIVVLSCASGIWGASIQRIYSLNQYGQLSF